MTRSVHDPLPDHYDTEDWEGAEAPLGPIRWHPVYVWHPGYQGDDEGYYIDAEYFTDQLGNEYNSVDHLALCAVAAALK